jgi:tRNA/tmRNA/rRNA uracil-C5-methylase (TrmA/RlmC/RlmD family)
VSSDELVELELDRPASGGAVGRVASGEVVFARLGLPGERVTARVLERRKTFIRAEVVDVLRPSLARVEPPCRYAHPGGCGGCDLQHASMDEQLSWKSAVASEHLQRIARLERVLDVRPVECAPEGSRTRIRCGIGADGRLGLRRASSSSLIELDACWLADPRLAPAFSRRWTGDEVELRAIGDGPPFAVTRRDVGDSSEYLVTDLSGRELSSSERSRVEVAGLRFEVGALSFWQSHRLAPEVLTREVLSALQLASGDRVVDLYSGVGLFAVAMARVVGATGRVDAVESSLDAANDLQRNAHGRPHVRVRRWSVSPRAINDLVYSESKVVLDPPRSGIGIKSMTALVARRPRRIVYVSCDTATFARDLRVALDGRYELTTLSAHDLFPMTEHLEIVGVLDASDEVGQSS